MGQGKGTLNTEKAKVNGAEVTEGKSKLDQIVEKMEAEQAEGADFSNLVNIELSSEIVGTLRGHFAQNLIYNIPRHSPKGAKHHRECDAMKGACPYDGSPHIHILGVGYQGALTALRAYGRMSATVVNMPEMVEQGDKLYWAAYGETADRHTGNDIGRWYLEPVMRKAGGKFVENEFGASIAQSKALRNVILALIPAKLMEEWIEDYKAGKQAFNVQRAKDMGYGPEKQSPASQERQPAPEKPKDKPAAQTPGGRALTSVIVELAEMVGREAEELTAFADSEYDTKGKAMLAFNRALNDEDQRSELRLKFTEWLKNQDKPEPDPTTGGDPNLDNLPDVPPKQAFLAAGEKRFANVEDLEAWCKRIVSETPWENWTDDNFETALPALLEVPLLAPDNTPAETEEEQEQENTKLTDITKEAIKVALLDFDDRRYQTIKALSFKARAAQAIQRDVESIGINELTEAEGMKVLESLLLERKEDDVKDSGLTPKEQKEFAKGAVITGEKVEEEITEEIDFGKFSPFARWDRD